MSLILQFDFEELPLSALEFYPHSLWWYINLINRNWNLNLSNEGIGNP